MNKKIHNIKNLKKIRRKLRKDSTKSEIILWNKIRNKAFGYKFRRQHSIGNFVVDFYCAELRLVVEIDGYIHGEEFKKQLDEKKENFLLNNDFKILRYMNEQVLFELDSVLQDLSNNLP
ncbi:MAG: endonuclease domain-containing protein [bacterium]|nr:endonuclease domain-containing protein [bacterium]